jgi:Txe/YoeB family toxin of Txe-Axe toxin-antitoxin module
MEAAGFPIRGAEKLMKRTPVLVFITLLLLVRFSHADAPPGFSWVNLETDKATMTEVRHVLHDESITAIREVGLEEGFVLVMTASRESGAPTPDFDSWSICNISLKTGKGQLLVFGYGVKLIDWIGAANDELAITYYHCWECEAVTIFTTLRFIKGSGWTARWPNKTQNSTYPQPGVVVFTTDVGDPDADNVDQVYAVVTQPGNIFAAGSWIHSRNPKTGRIEDDIERYSFDPKTGKDRVEKLEGQTALNWERRICAPSNIMIQPSMGQDSKACRSVLRTPTPPKRQPN